MRIHTRAGALVGALVAGSLLLAACGGDDDDDSASGTTDTTEAAEFSAELQEVIDAAEAEGTLLLDWGADVTTEEQFADWVAGFEDYYGIDIEVDNVPNPDMFGATFQLIGEFEADRDASTDVALGTENQVIALEDVDAVEEVDWSIYPDVPESAVEADGRAVSISTNLPGITYNTDEVDEADVPESLDDVLAMDDYQVAASSRGVNIDILAAESLWGEEEALQFGQDFADAADGIVSCTDHGRVGNGEFDVLAFDCGRNFAIKLQEEDAPVEWVAPSDAALLTHLYVSVPRNARHPNLAKLWANYLLTSEAQDVMYEYQYFDNHEVEGSETATVISEYEDDGVEFTEVDVAFFRENTAAFESVADQLAEIFTTG